MVSCVLSCLCFCCFSDADFEDGENDKRHRAGAVLCQGHQVFYFRGAESPVSEPIGRSREAVALLKGPGD